MREVDSHVNENAVEALLGDFGGVMDQDKFDRAYRKYQDGQITQPKDCERIVRVAKDHGFELTVDQADAVWRTHSEGRCASWLFMDDDPDYVIYDAILEFIDQYSG